MTRLPKRYFKSISDYVKTYYTAYGAQRAQKLYDAVKTVTKDFTRTDPVYVRIGEDGEPEIHYTMTQENGTSYFSAMKLGKATLIVDVYACINLYKLFGITSGVHTSAKKITVKRLKTQNANWLFQGTYADVDVTLADGFENKNIRGWFQACSTTTLPNIDMSHVTNIAYLGPLLNVAEVPAWDLSSVTEYDHWFGIGSKCVAFHAHGMTFPFDLSSTALKHDAILEVFNNLGTVSKDDGITLTLGSSKLALMSDDEKLIATEKGWYLA